MEINGTFDDRFSSVRDAFAANFAPDRTPEEVGASVAITVDGELVVDLWAGTVTGDDGVDKPWDRDTIVNVWSTTKTVSALCMLMLADRGEIDFYSPVAKVWPEFAANGKGDIEIRHVMSHTAGLAGWRDPITVEDLYDWDKVTSLLAAQEPWWEPGTASGYHGITQGYLEGEIVRRVTGQTIGEFAAKEVTGPLGADFHIGTHRRARQPRRPRDPAVEERARGARTRLARPSHVPIPGSPRQARQHHPVAAGRDPSRRRPRQRPVGGADPHPDGVRR